MTQDCMRNLYTNAVSTHATMLLTLYQEVLEAASQAQSRNPKKDLGFDPENFADTVRNLKGLVLGARLAGHDAFTITLTAMSAMAAFEEEMQAWKHALS